ncbi:hypothetical protein A2U01_0063973, partial [Trifolium medium]|nr:hypothetical protein [Trifolium medium]
MARYAVKRMKQLLPTGSCASRRMVGRGAPLKIQTRKIVT